MENSFRSSDEEPERKYSRPLEIADGIYWVGFLDVKSGLHCNPYVITDGEEAVVIDGGSRPDFPSVMMKILSAGIDPSRILALIYQHYDPDLCGSISNFEDIIGRDDLKVISAKSNHMFIRHYGISEAALYDLEELEHRFRFSSGRELRFIRTPYAHSEGSFVTFDEKSGVLFSSDLFGSYSARWELFLNLAPECSECFDYLRCPKGDSYCPIPDLLEFHRKIMPSRKALCFALEKIAKIPFSTIAPQHGSVIRKAEIPIVWDKLRDLNSVGIDRLIGNRSEFDLVLNDIGRK